MRDEQMIHIIVISSSESTTRPRPPEDYIYTAYDLFATAGAARTRGHPAPDRRRRTPIIVHATWRRQGPPAQPRHVAIRI